MEHCVWLLPLLFVFHDFEEIIGMRVWLARNGADISKRFPPFKFIFNNLTSTAGFALAVAEEFVILLIICGLTFTGNRVFNLLWLGTFIAFTLHLVVHIGQAVVIRKYIPALATSILVLPVSIWLIADCIGLFKAEILEIVIYSLVATIAVVANLFLAHWLARKFGEWVKNADDAD
jgi:hypothetical protein